MSTGALKVEPHPAASSNCWLPHRLPRPPRLTSAQRILAFAATSYAHRIAPHVVLSAAKRAALLSIAKCLTRSGRAVFC